MMKPPIVYAGQDETQIRNIMLAQICYKDPLEPHFYILKIVFIMQTCPCNVYPLTFHFYLVKLGFTGALIVFLYLL